MKTAVVEGHDIGGTCVNRGCVPSKALLAASGRVRELQNAMHMKALGIQVGFLPPATQMNGCSFSSHEQCRFPSSCRINHLCFVSSFVPFDSVSLLLLF